VNSRLSWRIIVLSGASAMLSLDQLTKHWALASLGAVGARIELAGPFNLTLVLNRSNAFGLIPLYGEGLRWALTALGVTAAVILLWCALRRSTQPPECSGARLNLRGSARKRPRPSSIGSCCRLVRCIEAWVRLGF
jgi:signal peptidase II